MDEYITIEQAAQIVKCSTKTIRRAIKSKDLTNLEEKPNRSRIALSQLNAYIEKRQNVSEAIHGHGHGQVKDGQVERITALEEEVIALRQAIQEVARLQQEVRGLHSRIQELENRLTSQSPSNAIETSAQIEPMAEPQAAEPVQTTKRRTTKQEEATFEIADFKRLWADSYICTAVGNEVKARWEIRPVASNGTNGQLYHVSYCNWDTTKVRRGKNYNAQKDRGEALVSALKERAIESLLQAGWVESWADELQKKAYLMPTD